MPDRNLVQALIARDESAVQVLIARYGDIVGGMAYNMLQDTQIAEEVTQDVMLRVWDRIETYVAPKEYDHVNLWPWMKMIARNLCLDEFRRRSYKRKPKIVLADSERYDASWMARKADYQPSVLDKMVEKEATDLVWRECDALNGSLQAEAFRLRYEGGLTTHELVEAMGAGVNTCKVWVHRGKQEIRRQLRRKDITMEDVYPPTGGGGAAG